jgi:glycosyltransferase involved in cell wall biosynthesis
MPEGYRIQQFKNTQKHKKFKVADGFEHFIQNQLNHKDLVILSGIFQPNIYSLYRLLRKYSIPYVVLPHDPYNPAIFSKNAHLKWPYWYLIESWVLKHASAIQVLDARHGNFLHDLKIDTPAIAVPNGFSQKDIYPEDFFTWNDGDVPNLLFLGRIDAHNKGLDLLLDAFAQVLETVDARLTLQGSDKGDRTSLKSRAVHLSLADKTSFLEPNYDIVTPLMIKNYDVFCLPSRFEGFGLSALEAMLAARVLLVSEVAGIAPHVQASGCGVVVKPEVSAIKSGLLELLARRSEWKEMGLRGRHYVLEKLSWESIAANALRQYQQLVEQH